MSHTYLDPSTVRVGQRSKTWPWIDFELIISTCEMTELKTNLTFEHLSWMILKIKICVDILIYFHVQNCQQNWKQNFQIIGSTKTDQNMISLDIRFLKSFLSLSSSIFH